MEIVLVANAPLPTSSDLDSRFPQEADYRNGEILTQNTGESSERWNLEEDETEWDTSRDSDASVARIDAEQLATSAPNKHEINVYDELAFVSAAGRNLKEFRRHFMIDPKQSESLRTTK